MGQANNIGRVGALAVALGIGSAIVGLAGEAQAEPDATSTSAGTSQSADAPRNHTRKISDKPWRGSTRTSKRGTGSADVKVAASEQDSDLAERSALPRTKRSTALRPLFSPKPKPASTPDAPAASSLLWTMVGSARREARDVEAAVGTSELPGEAFEAPVVTPDGTAYQVTREVFSRRESITHVSVLDDNAQVIASADIDGYAYFPAARPDGTVVVVTLGPGGRRSTVSTVDSAGTVTRIAKITGTPDRQVRVGADGALYISTEVPTFGVMGATRPYRLVRISPNSTAQVLPHDTAVELRPDGSAYLVSTQGGFSSVRVFTATGATRTVALPYGSEPSDPIVGDDGTVYVTAGVKGWFGSKTTRIYALAGTSSTVRTVDGLPGWTVVTPDGVYLETYTHPGSTDDGTGTTLISKITPTTLDTSDVIEGRIVSFLMQVAADGTVFAPLAVPASSTTTPVAIVAPDGTVAVVAVPGTPTQSSVAPGQGGVVSPATENVGYVNYTAEGSEHVAVLNTDGTIVRIVDLPSGAAGNAVVFGPDGAPYQLLRYTGPDGFISAYQVLALSTDTVTTEVPGLAGYIEFGPDGTGYLRVSGSGGAWNILGFDSTGNTVIPLSEFTSLTYVFTEFYKQRLLTFAPDGTAYVINNDLGPTASVYALTPSGAQKVLEAAGRSNTSQSFLSEFEPNGTAYVKLGTATRDTLVYSFSALAVV
ncbi:hypothetical protein [Mycobacterium sp. PSTR-4-N]|uniref:hypothetical protein n=1 Tax=Mycobacterium sp. PSTR-4-N TaxID=2917745 RepID=UPI001F14D32D|nr:hypothetical protein [Mycobacterium sp. PSTR-4-N]MCG7597683.1 hypothetical protein [Mycobacterium sp. PSTR-4-N]